MKLNLNNAFKNLFIFSLVWILTDGILRKWFFLSIASSLFYVKYILFGVTYLLFLYSKKNIPPIKNSYQLFIVLFVFICLIGSLNNTLNNSLIVSIVGLSVHLFFIPIIHLTQFLFTTTDAISKLSKIITYLAFPIGVLGMVQFYLPTDHILNGFVNEAQLISRVSSFTRVSSIFSFVKIYNAYLLFSITFLIPTILNSLIKRKSVLIESFALTVLIINMFMTGSRLPIGLMLFNILVIGIYGFINFSNLRKTVLVIFTMGFLSIIGLYFSTNLFSDSVDATLTRIENAELSHRTESTGFTDVELRMKDRLDIFKFSNQAGWFGYGIGMAYQGNFSLIKNPIPFYFEEEGERIVLELGIIGGIIMLLMRFSIFLFSLSILKRAKYLTTKLFLISLILYITPAILTLQMTTFSYMENFFYYFAFGLIIALYKIHQKELNQTA